MQLQRFVVLSLASGFGAGYLKPAPGTWGSLVAIPIWWLMRDLAWPVFALSVGVLVLIAIAVSQRADVYLGQHDSGTIVIDEIVGVLAAAIAVPFAWPQVAAVFCLFRLLDITKPGPIRWIDDKLEGGAGVVLDDVAAGLVACCILHAVRYALGGWW